MTCVENRSNFCAHLLWSAFVWAWEFCFSFFHSNNHHHVEIWGSCASLSVLIYKIIGLYWGKTKIQESRQQWWFNQLLSFSDYLVLLPITQYLAMQAVPTLAPIKPTNLEHPHIMTILSHAPLYRWVVGGVVGNTDKTVQMTNIILLRYKVWTNKLIEI